MQNISFKIIGFLVLSVFGQVTFSFSQDISYDLSIADSLFEQKKYTESFEIYNSILNSAEKYTPSMLLKMAYIKEGLGDKGMALYYLNLYYLHTSENQALDKMEKLAEEKKLEGYAKEDRNILQEYFYKYFNTLLISLGVIALTLFIASTYIKFKLKRKPYGSGLLTVMLLFLIFYLLNIVKPYNKGVIIERGGFIMSGPSAGASLIDSPEKGSKVDILGEKDVWIEISWKGKKGFIKSQYIKPLSI